MSDAFDPTDPSAASSADPGAAPAMPPGWYDDGTGNQRYWDGSAWAEQGFVDQGFVEQGYAEQGYAEQGYAAQGYVAGANVPALAVSDEDRSMAMLTQILGIFFSFLGPLIMYLTKGNESAFVKHHAAEALNFAITVAIAVTVCAILFFLIIPLLLIPFIWIGALVLQVMAAIAANKGEWYRFPMTLRLVPGAVG